MDRGSKKRARDEQLQQLRPVVSGASDEAAEKRKGRRKKGRGGDVSKELEQGQETRPPPGVFEFPWQEGGRLLTPEMNDSDMRDVFFSSLVDGCSASFGIPGDRLSPAAARGSTCLPEIEALWPSEAETDGVDPIWSSVLRQPLAAAAMHRKV